MFLILFLVGAVGIVTMAALGLMHGGGAHGGHGHGHGHFHFGGKGLAHGHGHGHATGHSGHGSHSESASSGMQSFAIASLAFFSPFNIFSLCLGIGGAGVLLAKYVPAATLWLFAIAGGLLFHYGAMRQIMNLVLKFESKPSEGLEGAVARPALAATSFDADGKGLISLNLDGQIVQLLATLEPMDREEGVLVSKGDEVVIVDVDPAKNTCRVTRGLSA